MAGLFHGPAICGKILHPLFGQYAVPTSFLKAPPILLTLLLLAACSVQPINGELRTKDNRPLLFSAQDKQLLLTPGKLSAFIDDQPASAESIRLKNDKGQIDIPTRPENFQLNHFQIDGAHAKTSTDLKGVWREQTLQVGPQQEFESCTTAGFCPQVVEILLCPNHSSGKRGDGCKRYYETQMRFAPDCPGHRPVENTYQTYTLTLELEFLDSTSKTERLAQFSGSSSPRQRIVSRRALGPCLLP